MKPKSSLIFAFGALAVLAAHAVYTFLAGQSVQATTWVTAGTNLTANVVSAASLGSTTTNAVALPYADTTGLTAAENLRVRFIQNVGTVPLLYCLGGTASVTNYHGIIAAGTVARDGLGSVAHLENWRGSVSVAVESGTGAWVAVEVVK